MGALLAVLREEVPRAHAAFRLGDVTPQSTLVDNHLVRDRALAVLSAFFSLVASVLVVVGVYGLLSYTVLQRTREIGIRLALGAQPAQIVALVLREVGGMTLIGLVDWRSRCGPHRPIHDRAVVRGHTVGHVEHRRAAARLAGCVRVRCGDSGTACGANRPATALTVE